MRKIIVSVTAIVGLLIAFGVGTPIQMPASAALLTSTPSPTVLPTATSFPTPPPVMAIVTLTPAVTSTLEPLYPPGGLGEWVEFIVEWVKRYGMWAAVGLLVLWGLARLLAKFWDKLTDTWAGAAARWLGERWTALRAWLGRGPDRETRALLERLLDDCEQLKLKGFVKEHITIVSLDSVYVPLFAAPEVSMGRMRPPRGGEPGLFLAREEGDRLVPVAQLLGEHRCLALVGQAGSGKSTFLRYVTLTLARALRDRRPALVRENLAGWEPKPLPLPLFLPLGGFGLYLKDRSDADKESPNPILLLNYMAHHFREVGLPKGFFEQRLKDGRCLVLLDGLDEVARFSDRRFISETIDRFARRYEGCRFVVTCRPEGYTDAAQLGGDFQRRDLEPLRWPEDVTLFVQRWHREVFSDTQAARDDATNLLHRLEAKEQIRALADNPLLLTVMAIVHRAIAFINYGRLDLRGLQNSAFPKVLWQYETHFQDQYAT